MSPSSFLKNHKFVLLPVGDDMTVKQQKRLSKSITNNGGLVFDLSRSEKKLQTSFLELCHTEKITDIVVSSSKLTFQALWDYLQAYSHMYKPAFSKETLMSLAGLLLDEKEQLPHDLELHLRDVKVQRHPVQWLTVEDLKQSLKQKQLRCKEGDGLRDQLKKELGTCATKHLGDAKKRPASLTKYASEAKKRPRDKVDFKQESEQEYLLRTQGKGMAETTRELIPDEELIWSGVSEPRERVCVPETFENRYTRQQRDVVKNERVPLNENLNAELTLMFERLADYYSQKQDKTLHKQFHDGALQLKRLPFRLKSQEDIPKHKLDFGKEATQKIHEYLKTGRIAQLDTLKVLDNPKAKVTHLFSSIWGIAANMAGQLYDEGFRTLQDLKENSDTLGTRAKIGLELYEDLKHDVTRDEIAKIVERIQSRVSEHFAEHELSIIPCGDFRRGKPLSKSIQVVMCKKADNGKPLVTAFKKVVTALKKDKLLTHHLTHLDDLDEKKSLTYVGVCQLEKDLPYRRIDIKMYNKPHYAFALLHLTGSDAFSRALRTYAKRSGYSLSEYGLFPVEGGSKDPNPIICHTEKEIFDQLGLKYRHPWQREVDEEFHAEMDRAQPKLIND